MESITYIKLIYRYKYDFNLPGLYENVCIDIID